MGNSNLVPDAMTIPAGQFKARCLKLMDEANAEQRPIVITKRGKVVGSFVPSPPAEKPFRSIIGRTPGIKVPSPDEWKELKSQLASEWLDPAETFARLSKDSSGKA